MRKFDIKKAILVGFSGGMIVRKFAHMFEKNLEGLIIINSPHKRTLVQQKSIDKRVKQAENKGPQSTVNDAIKDGSLMNIFYQNQKIKLIKIGY